LFKIKPNKKAGGTTEDIATKKKREIKNNFLFLIGSIKYFFVFVFVILRVLLVSEACIF